MIVADNRPLLKSVLNIIIGRLLHHKVNVLDSRSSYSEFVEAIEISPIPHFCNLWFLLQTFFYFQHAKIYPKILSYMLSTVIFQQYHQDNIMPDFIVVTEPAAGIAP